MSIILRDQVNTTESLKKPTPQACHTCKQRKEGLFTMDPNGRPQCAGCARAAGNPID